MRQTNRKLAIGIEIVYVEDNSLMGAPGAGKGTQARLLH